MRDLEKEELKVGDLVEIAGFVYDTFGNVCNFYKMGAKGIVIGISVNSFGEKTYRVDPLQDNRIDFLCGTDHYYLRRELRKCGSVKTEDK